MNIWYFAYGSNVKLDLMRENIGDCKLSKRAIARNFKLIFNQYSKNNWHGYIANLQRTDNFEDKVLGVVYHITDAQVSKLQNFEGAEPMEISIELEDGNEIKNAKTIIWNSLEREHEPPHAYRMKMEEGLIEHGYDGALVRKIFIEKFGH
ncbi:MAG: gamma-glutamylcyclotransferase [Nitrososphaerales archaeon]|jgi:cation transport regulator ChaC